MYLVIDLEATCAEEMPREQMEIIEIGAVWATPEGVVLDEFQTFVRPSGCAVLTPFCKELTSIQQSHVDAAPSFAEAMQAFSVFTQKYPNREWASWGRYDLLQWERDCQRNAVTNPLAGFHHTNLKNKFAKGRKIKEVGVTKALEIAGLGFEGTLHRGIDDARNIAKLVPLALPPIPTLPEKQELSASSCAKRVVG